MLTIFTLSAAVVFLAEAKALEPAEPRELRISAERSMAAEGCATDCFKSAQRLLAAAALGGDRVALIRLEEARREGVAGAVSREVIVGIENERAKQGDAIAAWRLVRRDEGGEEVFHSPGEVVSTLKIVAEDSGYPKSRDAAFRLCSMQSELGSRDAHAWCRKAAAAGHAGAAVISARVAESLP